MGWGVGGQGRHAGAWIREGFVGGWLGWWVAWRRIGGRLGAAVPRPRAWKGRAGETGGDLGSTAGSAAHSLGVRPAHRHGPARAVGGGRAPGTGSGRRAAWRPGPSRRTLRSPAFQGRPSAERRAGAARRRRRRVEGVRTDAAWAKGRRGDGAGAGRNGRRLAADRERLGDDEQGLGELGDGHLPPRRSPAGWA